MKNSENEKKEEEAIKSYEIIDERVFEVEPIPFRELAIINEQNQYSVCKVLKDGKPCGTGFICIIPFPDKLSQIQVLFTCYHVLSDEDIEYGKEINLIFNDKNRKTLYMDKSRKKYTSNENQYDITMIEIKKDDEFQLILETDDNIYKKGKLNDKYQNESIYLIHYPEGKIASFSINVIQKIDSQNVMIEHLCTTKHGSSGAPIIDLNTHKVIGIHIGKDKNYNFNCGVVLRKPIEAFQDKYTKLKREKSIISVNSVDTTSEADISFRMLKPVDFYYKKNNEINEVYVKVKIRKKDINKEVYFLDNTNFSDWFTKKRHFHDFLKELNETNTKVYINDKEIPYKKYFIPKEEGIYDIKIVFNIKIKDISFMFSDCKNIISVDFSNFDSSEATDISHMFYQDEQLKSINFTSFNTKNVVNMSYMFLKCSKLEDLDLSSFNVNKVQKMSDMFLDCINLTTVKVNKDSYDKIKKKLKQKVKVKCI